MVSQTQSGKAWELGLARKIAALNEALIERNADYERALHAYRLHERSDRAAIDRAANSVVDFLVEHDEQLGDIQGIALQGDQRGRAGDVRDIVLRLRGAQELGISAKHRHRALKHSRLSKTIDFGQDWYGVRCSPDYWRRVTPLFDELERAGRDGGFWRDLPDKADRFYRPILCAFMQEVERQADPQQLVRYVVGRYDFYKAVKTNGAIEVQSFNLGGGLSWGGRLPMPTRIIEFRRDVKRAAYAELTLDRGWALSFRLHNAESRIVPSLKFDIQLIGTPQELAHYSASYS